MPTRQTTSSTPRGYFGIAIYGAKHDSNVGSLWRTAESYGAALLATVGRRYVHQAADTTKASRHTPLVHYTDLDDLIRHLPLDCPLIGVELDPRATPLEEFVHPERGLYLLGAEDTGLPTEVLDRCDHLVEIPTTRISSLNVSVAGGIVTYSRYMARRRTPVLTT